MPLSLPAEEAPTRAGLGGLSRASSTRDAEGSRDTPQGCFRPSVAHCAPPSGSLQAASAVALMATLPSSRVPLLPQLRVRSSHGADIHQGRRGLRQPPGVWAGLLGNGAGVALASLPFPATQAARSAAEGWASFRPSVPRPPAARRFRNCPRQSPSAKPTGHREASPRIPAESRCSGHSCVEKPPTQLTGWSEAQEPRSPATHAERSLATHAHSHRRWDRDAQHTRPSEWVKDEKSTQRPEARPGHARAGWAAKVRAPRKERNELTSPRPTHGGQAAPRTN